MKVLRCVLLFCLALVHSNPTHESGHKNGNKPPPLTLKWMDQFTIALSLPDGQQDEISLRHTDTAGGVAVPCLFEGTLHNDDTGNVAVSGCRDGDQTQVTIVSKYTNSSMFNIVNRNKTEEVLDPYRASSNTEEDRNESDEDANLKKRPKPVKRSVYPILSPDYYDEYSLSHSGSDSVAVPADLIYGVELAYEDTFLAHMGNNKLAAEQYILAVIKHAQVYLLDQSLGTKIHLHIRSKPKHLAGESLKIDDVKNNVSPSMEKAKTIPSDVALITFIHSDDNDRWMGVANRRFGCDPNAARAIIKWRCSVQKAAMTTAHEIAHLLGPYHDEQEDTMRRLGHSGDCSGEGLMSDGLAIDDQPEKWSDCTRLRIEKWFNNFGQHCPRDRLMEAPACSSDSNSWAPPCLCGCGANGRSLCTDRHTFCESATSTCLGTKDLDHLITEVSWLKSEMLKLAEKMELHHPTLPPQTTTPALPPLPPQASVCSSYSTLSDPWRQIDYVNRGAFTPHCDQTGRTSEYTNLDLGTLWYRFEGAAGTQLPTGPAPVGGGPTTSKRICGTNRAAHIASGGNPTIRDGIVSRDLCFEWKSNSCDAKTTVKVAACRDIYGEYFVYQLQPVPLCHCAYCAIIYIYPKQN